MVVNTTQIYTYNSEKYGKGTIMLNTYGTDASQTIEYTSPSAGITDVHGHWRIDDAEGIMRVEFNCRQGTRKHDANHPGRTWSLHATTFWKRAGSTFPGVPDDADWAGVDDKGCLCWLTHIRSTRLTRTTPGKPPGWELAHPL